jgi:hypothetical protein
MRLLTKTENAIYFKQSYVISFKISPKGELVGSCTCMSFSLREKCRHLREAQEMDAFKRFSKELSERLE